MLAPGLALNFVVAAPQSGAGAATASTVSAPPLASNTGATLTVMLQPRFAEWLLLEQMTVSAAATCGFYYIVYRCCCANLILCPTAGML